ncbi:MAG: Dihydrolipoamide acetyltransferase component of pyruvate dehydrogenase complex [Burkholderiaceae bacterium]|nr:Dihydrolipoamide acetyltransferase component of pyruvate dehydrogenase complex [Burkholderiaceae bacterium]
MSQIIEVKVPDIGDYKNIPVIEVFVKVGDTITVEDTLVTLESDKATLDVPSSHAGVVKNIAVKVGDKVSEGSVVVTLEAADASNANPVNTTSTLAAPQEPAVQTTAAAAIPIPVERELLAIPEVTPTATVAMSKTAYASPSVRQFARELDVNLDNVTGTGSKNRITQDDVRAYIKTVMNGAAACPTPNVTQPASLGGGLDLLPWPQIDFTKFGEIDVHPLSRIKKISGQNLSRNWVMIPHVTNNEVADITELEQFRVTLNREYEKQSVKFTLLAFLIKACVQGLKKFPEFNASLDGDNLVYKKYYNIGFAADTPNGLVVPVIKDADKKSVTEIAVEMSELAKNAREGKLKPTDMQGGCFSISSLGGIGGTTFTPIINAPEVAILGVSRSSIQPVWNGTEFVPRLMCPLSLSYDHRVIDGAAAARFNAYLANILNDYRRVLL